MSEDPPRDAVPPPTKPFELAPARVPPEASTTGGGVEVPVARPEGEGRARSPWTGVLALLALALAVAYVLLR